MTVTWTTFAAADSLVVFGPEPQAAFTRWARGRAAKFVDGGKLHRAMYIHRVNLTGLLPGHRYGKTLPLPSSLGCPVDNSVRVSCHAQASLAVCGKGRLGSILPRERAEAGILPLQGARVAPGDLWPPSPLHLAYLPGWLWVSDKTRGLAGRRAPVTRALCRTGSPTGIVPEGCWPAVEELDLRLVAP